jgi:hypothetical protein
LFFPDAVFTTYWDSEREGSLAPGPGLLKSGPAARGRPRGAESPSLVKENDLASTTLRSLGHLFGRSRPNQSRPLGAPINSSTFARGLLSLLLAMASIEFAGILEAIFLQISTIPSPYFAWAALASYFFRTLRTDCESCDSKNGFFWFVLNMLLLRTTLVIAILLHEFAHLIVAAFISDLSCSVFTWKNLLGNSAGLQWMRALLPFSSWPQFVPFIELHHAPSAKHSRWIFMAGPIMSILLAVVCTKFAVAFSSVQSLKTIAVGTWTIAIGCFASDVFTQETVSKRFQCGNFGMLVICAMDR